MCLNDSATKFSCAGIKNKDVLAQVGMLTVSNLITATNSPQCFTAKPFNDMKLKLPSFLSPAASLCICYRQANDPFLSLCASDWETKTKSTSDFAHICSTRDLFMCVVTEAKKHLQAPPILTIATSIMMLSLK